jgi:hypothetical protein
LVFGDPSQQWPALILMEKNWLCMKKKCQYLPIFANIWPKLF